MYDIYYITLILYIIYIVTGNDRLVSLRLLGRREQKTVFSGRYIVEKSVFDRHREEKTEEKSIRGKIREKSVQSSIFRQKIGKYQFFHQKITTVEHTHLCWNFGKNIGKYR